MDTPKKRIVIVGGGFGGVHAALHLERTFARDAVEVTLVDPQNFLLFTPMLHEVASGSLDPSSIVVPIRQVLRRAEYLQGEAIAIDLDGRSVTVRYGLDGRTRTIRFDQLLLAAGSETRFLPGLRAHAFGMKTIQDAIVLRNWLIGLLERAEIEPNAAVRQALLTVIVAGGGFSGVETAGAINDFLRDVVPHYRRLSVEQLSFVLVQPSERLLSEFDPQLGRYAESRLRAAGIDVRLHTKVTAFDGRRAALETSHPSPVSAGIAARTLIWTAGVSAAPLIESLPVPKERGRIQVTDTMAVPGYAGVWACGDCAAVPDQTGKLYPTTAQHAIRQGFQVGRNMAAVLRERPHQVRPFRYRMIGQLATIGRNRGVASIGGVRFSGLVAWFLWRGTYLLKLPGVGKRVRVGLEWLLDLCFPRDAVQLLTAQSLRSGRLDELLESARVAEARDAAGIGVG